MVNFNLNRSTEDWISLSTLAVKYPKNDLLGLVLAYFSLTPYALIVSYVTLIIFNRDLKIIFMFLGQLLNETICNILKRIIKQPRPSHEDVYLKLYFKKDFGFGMPSQHVQFQAYFTIYCILYLFCINNKSPFLKRSLVLGLVFCCLITFYSRVYLLYHFWYQCLVGLIIGSVWGYVWFKFNSNIIEKKFFATILSWKISKCFDLNDGGNIKKRE